MELFGNLQGEVSKTELIFAEFFAKSLHIIVESRIPCGEHSGASSFSSSSSSCPKDKWFNLALGEYPPVLEKMEPGSLSLLEPMIVDVILLRNSDYRVDIPLFLTSGKQGSSSNASEGFGGQIILERWTVKCEYRKSSTRDIHSGRISSGSGTPRWEDGKKVGSKIGPGKGKGLSGTGDINQGAGASQSSSPAAEVPVAYKKTYKRLLILLRSVYCTARLLPAYRLFCLANSSSHDCNFSLFHRVSSSPEPLSHADEAEMHSFNFTPVETPCGRICLSVSYRSTRAVTALEDAAPLLPEIITDYVGSPAAELPKRFPNDLTFTPGKKKVHMTTPPLSVPGSSACTGFVRRHSWSGNIHRLLPSSQLSFSPSHRLSLSPSPSPSYSDIHGSPNVPNSCPIAPHRYLRVDHSPSPRSSPQHPLSSQTFSSQGPSDQRPASFDEYWLSPPFSPSPSPSPPAHFAEGNLTNPIRYPGSAPVSIPVSSASRTPRSWATDCYQNRTLLPPPSPKSQKSDALRKTASANSRITCAQSPVYDRYPSQWQCSNKPTLSRPTESQTGRTALLAYGGQKVYKDGKDGNAEVTGVKFSPSGSPKIPFSRSLSKVSHQDEIDYEDFSCPFAVDDDETTDCRSRTDSLDGKGSISESSEIGGQAIVMHKRSHGAAVGALVNMLASASPLCPDFGSLSSFPSTTAELQGTTSEHGAPSHSVSTSCSGRDDSQMVVHKTTADALEELRGYREMKDNLMSQSGTQSVRRSFI
ncbi:autophagy-related protein 13b isoform X1 [Cryptomeria japonica]|uniref:autophagy-related protein 13b isoform X1 n=1 Tax=Cryptomeria japonica TaxID=3369 RepID=UPI0025ACEC8F|nr:autophagy-related protein 13b isoform X1 [Cryptomeria japonica]